MTNMQRLMAELRRHATDYDRATDPEQKRLVLRRFRVAFLLGNQTLGLREFDGVESEHRSEESLVPFGTSEGGLVDQPAVVARPWSGQESETHTRTTSHTVTRTGTDGGASDSAGRSESAGGCPYCGWRAGEGDVEWRSTTRTIGVGRSRGRSITGSKDASTTPSEPQTRGENEGRADEHDRNEASE